MKRLFFIILCLFIGGCALSFPVRPSPTPIYPDLVISMDRGPCFGACPFYRITIDGDGQVTYKGEGFVAVEGTRYDTITPEQIQELVTAFENANFFSLQDSYKAPATDLPSVTTSITMNGRSKSIWHYGLLTCNGDLDDAPKELCELENKIDEVVNSDQWVKQK